MRLLHPASAGLAALLLALTQQLDWVGLKTAPWLRLLWMGGALLLSALVYFGALWLLRLPLRLKPLKLRLPNNLVRAGSRR